MSVRQPLRAATTSTGEVVPAARLEGITKRFGNVVAVDGVDLDVREGEFFSMLGPSGSGKTTLLRLIAGFETPTSGRIVLHGDDVTDRPPFDRDVNTVFQDYALFPHMNVAQNVEYGLKVRKVRKAERDERVSDALGVVRLTGFESRRPGQMSGGQRQRVALARALVNRPRILLLDEPLGALDRRLREEMQIELKHIQERVGITFVFVTHDQGEALTMSDRIAVFNDGQIEQVGTPAEIYEEPETEFVATFVGTTNLLAGPSARSLLGDDTAVSIRPESIRLGDPNEPTGSDEVSAAATVADVQYLGASTRYRVTLDDGSELVVDHQNSTATSAGSVPGLEGRVSVIFRRDHARHIETTTANNKGDGE